jgi:D-serine deaminase-like pyridoxal phosphate-dependent protein
LNFIGLSKDEMDTPALLIDLDVMETNLKRMAEYIKKTKTKLRAHTKVHRCPAIAHKQIDLGAKGICCQKVGEAEVMAESGIKDIIVTNEIVTVAKILRLLSLSKVTQIAVPVDNFDNAKTLSKIALKNKLKLNVLVDIHMGSYRCGVEPGIPAKKLATSLLKLKGLNLIGLMGFEGQISFILPREKRHMECKRLEKQLIDTKHLIEREGVRIEEVSTGTTGTYDVTAIFPEVTEVQAGTYILMDTEYQKSVPEFECALSILSTIISKPSDKRAITDCGLMSINTLYSLPTIVGYNGIEVKELHAENTILNTLSNSSINLGEKVEFQPSYLDGTINLHDTVYGMRDEKIEAIWRIAGRGRSF